MRITFDGDVKELCTSRQCDPKACHKEGERATGRFEEAKELNSHLALLKMKAYEARSILISENHTITAQAIKNRLTGKQERAKGILEVFRQLKVYKADIVCLYLVTGYSKV